MAYTRILNNLLQNIITHSAGDNMALRIFENEQQAQIVITDNSKGMLHCYTEWKFNNDRKVTVYEKKII